MHATPRQSHRNGKEQGDPGPEEGREENRFSVSQNRKSRNMAAQRVNGLTRLKYTLKHGWDAWCGGTHLTSSTQEAEAEAEAVLGQPGLHGETLAYKEKKTKIGTSSSRLASLGYAVRPFSKSHGLKIYLSNN